MGAGGNMLDPSKANDILKRVPVEPPFSLSDLKKAIPAHCFERSLIRSSYYVVHDLVVAYVFYFLADKYIPILPYPLAYLAWPVYWFCQASILTGLWVIGHECGHHAFSDYQWIVTWKDQNFVVMAKYTPLLFSFVTSDFVALRCPHNDS